VQVAQAALPQDTQVVEEKHQQESKPITEPPATQQPPQDVSPSGQGKLFRSVLGLLHSVVPSGIKRCPPNFHRRLEPDVAKPTVKVSRRSSDKACVQPYHTTMGILDQVMPEDIENSPARFEPYSGAMALIDHIAPMQSLTIDDSAFNRDVGTENTIEPYSSTMSLLSQISPAHLPLQPLSPTEPYHGTMSLLEHLSPAHLEDISSSSSGTSSMTVTPR